MVAKKTRSNNIQTAIEYLDLPTKQLLDKFGEGKHIPGSGSATALSALLACELIKTVCKLTRSKPEYHAVHNALEYIQKQVESIHQPELFDLFNKDISVFDQVSKLRKKRDKEKNENVKKKLGREAIDKLKEATEIPLKICGVSIHLIDHAFAIFDTGFKSARGDSGVAISYLLSSISGGLFVTFLNLKTARQSKWASDIMSEAEQFAKQYNLLHQEAIRKMTSLYSEGLPEGSSQGTLQL